MKSSTTDVEVTSGPSWFSMEGPKLFARHVDSLRDAFEVPIQLWFREAAVWTSVDDCRLSAADEALTAAGSSLEAVLEQCLSNDDPIVRPLTDDRSLIIVPLQSVKTVNCAAAAVVFGQDVPLLSRLAKMVVQSVGMRHELEECQ